MQSSTAGLPRLIVMVGAQRGLERYRRFAAGKNILAARRAGAAIQQRLPCWNERPNSDAPPYADVPQLRELNIGFGDCAYVALYRDEPADDAVDILALRHHKEAGYRELSGALCTARS
jgi:plasmid stabilization system protein ParE